MSERGIELGIASQYIDAGDIVVAQFTVDGTNDGAIGFTEADRTQNIFGILRNLSLRQGRADRFGRLLLRSIHSRKAIGRT